MYGVKGTSAFLNSVARQSGLTKQLAAAHGTPKSSAFLGQLSTRNVSAGKLSYTTSRASAQLNKTTQQQQDEKNNHSGRPFLRTTNWQQVAKLSKISQARFKHTSAVQQEQQQMIGSTEEAIGQINNRIMEASRVSDYTQVITEFVAGRQAGTPMSQKTYEAVVEAYHSMRSNNQPMAPMLTVYDDMIANDIHPTSRTYAMLLRSLCNRENEVNRNANVLRRRIERKGEQNQPAEVHVLQELESENNMQAAMALFDRAVKDQRTDEFDLDLYNKLLRMMSLNGNTRDGLYIYEQLEQAKNVSPNHVTFAMLITLFGSAGDFKAAHECFSEYKAVKNRMKTTDDSYVYNALVMAHTNAGDIKGALEILETVMVQDKVDRTISAYNRVLNKASILGQVETVETVAARLKTDPTLPKPDVFTHGILLSLYSKLDNMEKANEAFNSMVPLDMSKQGGYIMDFFALCRRKGDMERAREVLAIMESKGMWVDMSLKMEFGQVESSQNNAIKSITDLKAATEAGEVPPPSAVANLLAHTSRSGDTVLAEQIYELVKNPFEQLQEGKDKAFHMLYNRMLSAYARQNNHAKTMEFYNLLRERNLYPDGDSYGALLVCLATKDDATLALKYYDEAKANQVPMTLYFYNVVLSKLAQCRKVDQVLEVFETMRESIQPNSITYAAVISACIRTSAEQKAEAFFREMVHQPRYQPRIGVYNSMIQYYVQQKPNRDKALEYYHLSQKHNLRPSAHTYKLLMEAYSNIPPYDMVTAHSLLGEMSKRHHMTPTAAHYATLIESYGCLHRDVSSAMAVYNEMVKAGVAPDAKVYQAMINSYIENGDVHRAEELYDSMITSGARSSPYIENLFIQGYATQGDLAKAEAAYARTQDTNETGQSIVREPSTYAAMVKAYLANNQADKAAQVLESMRAREYPAKILAGVEDILNETHSETHSSASV
ncbi:hypothetical protein BCR43DRAFT_494131 [Syncephalastrum racemosum]|uniref:Uncharacterized protein n=1 Tax=Syncephalastrum racemosum TaxID=13706 RepID=A0A1X2H7H0_SYNRA|nr:hypothetical protein BCR43DRAFT_494131 [Syncephalastrum racemosum]